MERFIASNIARQRIFLADPDFARAACQLQAMNRIPIAEQPWVVPRTPSEGNEA
jgi:hypothetical protein